MDDAPKKRVELFLPMRTLLLVVAAFAVVAAFIAIGETFLIVFVGIFLALVFEYPVRFVMAKTRMSATGSRAGLGARDQGPGKDGTSMLVDDVCRGARCS